MSESPLYRAAGPVALAAGVFFVITDLGRYPLIGNRLALATDPLLMAVNAAYFFAFVGLMVALIAVHGRLEGATGRFGMVAFLFAVLGIMMQGGNMWFDGFAVPWLADVFPQVFTVRPTLPLQIGGLLSYVLFALGWVLYGLAALRARAVPVGLALALVVGGVLGYNSGLPPYGTPIGLAVAGLGTWLIHRDRGTARTGMPDSRSRSQNSRI
jgi:hypothetical protein